MKNYIIALGAAVLFFAGCKKDDDTPATPRDFLTTGEWRLTALTATYNIGGTPTTDDAYASMDACEKDDLFKFTSDNKLRVDEGPTKCDPSDPQTEDAGTWALDPNNTKLQLVSTAMEELNGDYTIDELSATSLKIQIDKTVTGFPIVVNLKVSFTKN